MGLRANDLHDLVKPVFEVDSFQSKMGTDEDIVVVSFSVLDEQAAKDLVDFIEKGYGFVLDADATPGELSDGRYKVFVEIERNRRISDQILEVLDGVGKLTGIDKFKFRYHKSFHSVPASDQTLTELVPRTSNEYDIKIKENHMNNFSNFFNKSYLESIAVDDDDIIFRRKYSDPLRMRITSSGPRHNVYENLKGPMMIEGRDIAEILYITKYLGNYNISKIGNSFVFENEGYAVVLEKV